MGGGSRPRLRGWHGGTREVASADLAAPVRWLGDHKGDHVCIDLHSGGWIPARRPSWSEGDLEPPEPPRTTLGLPPTLPQEPPRGS